MTDPVRPPGIGPVALLVASAGPVSLDRLVSLDLARPTELWRWIEESRASKLLAEDAQAGPGWFSFQDEAHRSRVLAAARPEDWRALLDREGVAAAMLAAAQVDLKARRFRPASATLQAVLQLVGRAGFPGGDRGWLDAVAGRVRVSTFNERIEPRQLDEAMELAIREGDLRAQAVLAAARGFAASPHGTESEATGWFERALEAADSIGDRAVTFEVHVRIAYGEIIQGRQHSAIATFERLLGDLPEECIPLPPELAPPFAALPEAPLGVLFATYGTAGQHGRAFDMLHRMREVGTQLARPELVAVGDTFLASLYGGLRDLDGIRAHGEPALAFWKDTGTEPWLLWHVAQQLAFAHTSERRFEEACAMLELGQRARIASGVPFFSGSTLFETLERLEVEGVTPPPGMDLEMEIERMLHWPGLYMPAVAMRYRARRLERGTEDERRADEIDLLLARSVELLRTSRANPLELARSLEEASQRAAGRSRSGEADRLAAEARELLVALGRATQADPAGQAHLLAALVELGRVGALAERSEGIWGHVAARLCAVLGAESCALVEATSEGPRPLATRGGGPGWLPALEALARERAFPATEQLAAPATGAAPVGPRGQLLVVPFASAAVGRRGWAFFQNRHSRPAISASDRGVVAAVEAQLGVLLENVTFWQELAAARARLEQENRYYRAAAPAAEARGRIVGDSPAIRQVFSLVERVAPATMTVLVTGETGVGKELVAQEIHRLSSRSDKPFIAIHIASLAPGLVASGLFGHERGAFTGATELVRGRFELAHGGTLFLDEIGELGLEDQVRLLRVLQEGTFERVGGTRPIRSDFRLVAATNRDLAAEVKARRFREDLFFRLSAFPVHVPPLRERREEIPTLALYFMEKFQRQRGVRFQGIGEADVGRLIAHRWPGNVRELEHVIERAVLLSDPPRLRIPPLEAAGNPGAKVPGPDEWITLEEAERRYVRKVVEHARGRVAGPGGVADILGLNASTANWRIAKLGLKPELVRARRG